MDINNAKVRKNTPPPKKEIGAGVFHSLNTLPIPCEIELRTLIRSLKSCKVESPVKDQDLSNVNCCPWQRARDCRIPERNNSICAAKSTLRNVPGRQVRPRRQRCRNKSGVERWNVQVRDISGAVDCKCRKSKTQSICVRVRRPYQSRHTFACWLLTAGANPSFIASQLGHENAKMVYEIYSKWIGGMDRNQVELLNSTLPTAVPHGCPKEKIKKINFN